MPRPHRCRCIGFLPTATVFKPSGIPARRLEGIELRLDELEALRLADLQGLYHDEAARGMGISRSTFGRLVEAAANLPLVLFFGSVSAIMAATRVSTHLENRRGCL